MVEVTASVLEARGVSEGGEISTDSRLGVMVNVIHSRGRYGTTVVLPNQPTRAARLIPTGYEPFNDHIKHHPANTFAIFTQTLIHPQIAQIIAEKSEEMASNLRKSAKSADKERPNGL